MPPCGFESWGQRDQEQLLSLIIKPRMYSWYVHMFVSRQCYGVLLVILRSVVSTYICTLWMSSYVILCCRVV